MPFPAIVLHVNVTRVSDCQSGKQFTELVRNTRHLWGESSLTDSSAREKPAAYINVLRPVGGKARRVRIRSNEDVTLTIGITPNQSTYTYIYECTTCYIWPNAERNVNFRLESSSESSSNYTYTSNKQRVSKPSMHASTFQRLTYARRVSECSGCVRLIYTGNKVTARGSTLCRSMRAHCYEQTCKYQSGAACILD